MGLAQKQLLVPDETILSEIFPGIIDLKPSSCNIITNNVDSCTFRIQLDTAPPLESPKDLLIRLERSEKSLATLAIFQRLAKSQLNDLIPSVLHVGTTTTLATEQVQYFVTPYFTDVTTLEDVWDMLDETNQQELVKTVIVAVEKLQKLDLSQNLNQTPYIAVDESSSQAVKITIGDLQRGFSPNVKQFLSGLLQPENGKTPDWKLLETDKGIEIQSAHQDIGQIDFSHSELDVLQQNAVLCHNDLEPRNFLVRRESSGNYELTTIIDWEMVGLFPFAYEYGYKDTVLGSSNLSYSWYRLFKNQSSHLLPQGECHTKFVKAPQIIDNSVRKSMVKNVGRLVQHKWLEREQVEESSDPRQGWVRKDGANPPEGFSKDDQSKLEYEALKQLGHI
jgi:thiamine kinase-like enzyme